MFEEAASSNIPWGLGPRPATKQLTKKQLSSWTGSATARERATMDGRPALRATLLLLAFAGSQALNSPQVNSTQPFRPSSPMAPPVVLHPEDDLDVGYEAPDLAHDPDEAYYPSARAPAPPRVDEAEFDASDAPPSDGSIHAKKKPRLVRFVVHTGRTLVHAAQKVVRSIKHASLKVIGLFIHDPDLQEITAVSVAYVTAGALLLTIAGTFGVDIKPILSLSTLAGFAISISAKKILSDTFSAAYVIWIRPFRRGDTIRVGEMGGASGYDGEVLSVDYHFVRLRQPGGKEVMLPTHQVYGKTVVRAERPAGNHYRKAAPL
jgi:hypothetical protein